MDKTAFKITEVPDIGIPVYSGYDFMTRNERRAQTRPAAPLPDWLSDAPLPSEQTRLPRFYRSKDQLELEEMVFDIFFETFIDAIVTNANPLQIIRADPRGIDPGRFMRWIKKDAKRQERFEEAQEIASELLVYQNDAIAEGTDTMEDIERSKLRLKQNEFKIKSWNKKRYGDSKQVDVNVTTVDMRALLEQRDQQIRTLEGVFETVETTEVKEIDG